MNRKRPILWSVILILLLDQAFSVELSLTGLAQGSEWPALGGVTPDPVSRTMLAQINRDRTLNDIRQLTGDVPICSSNGCNLIDHRKQGSVGLDWAMSYVQENLVNRGYAPELWDWSSAGYAGRDLIVRKPGVVTPTEEIYVVAHLDGVKDTAPRYPAADDNASGAVDLLEVARILEGYSFDRTIVFLFSTGEEVGTLGVSAYLDHFSPAELGRIKYAINVDMIGYDGNGDKVMELWHGGHPPSLALTQLISETIYAYQLNLIPKLVVGCG